MSRFRVNKMCRTQLLETIFLELIYCSNLYKLLKLQKRPAFYDGSGLCFQSPPVTGTV